MWKMSQRTTLEQAKGLKELGYDVPCRSYYHPHNGLSECSEPDDYNRETWAKGYHSAPTLDEAANWLRGKGLHVMTMPDWEDGKNVYTATVWRISNDLNPQPDIVRHKGAIQSFRTHSAALSAAITASINELKKRE